MGKTIWDKKWEIIKGIERKYVTEGQNDYSSFWHYTSLPVLFNILEGDEFWASNVRFSNDSMEEKMLEQESIEMRDDYILCFCEKGDMLSQWRGYCHNGGAAIKLNLLYAQDYSILHSDFDTSGNYIVYKNTPLPVVYLDPSTFVKSRKRDIKNIIALSGYSSDIGLDDILPYIKNGYFYEEKESRFVFSNINGSLSKCIRFRTLEDGVKVPYIVIRHGIAGKMKGNSATDVSKFDDAFIQNAIDNSLPIWIEEGCDQEVKYYETIKKIEDYRNRKGEYKTVSVFCKGKLPIEEIVVAPTYARERKAEQIKRFCMSKYWLRNVKVSVSKIPYIQPLL